MKKIVSERNIVILLFVLSFVAFAFAVEDGKRLDRLSDAPIKDSSSVSSSIDTSKQHLPE